MLDSNPAHDFKETNERSKQRTKSANSRTAEQKALSLWLAPAGSSASFSARSRHAGLGDGWRDKLRRAASAGFLGTHRLHSPEERRPRRRRSRRHRRLETPVICLRKNWTKFSKRQLHSPTQVARGTCDTQQRTHLLHTGRLASCVYGFIPTAMAGSYTGLHELVPLHSSGYI